MVEQLSIRSLAPGDDAPMALIIRAVLTEFGANKPGTVYYDPTTDQLHALFSRPGSAYWVLEAGGKLAGGGGVFPTGGLPEGCCELVKLYLLPEARGKGYGKRLMGQCFDSARKLGYTHMYLETMPELTHAMGLYERCGFGYLKGPLGNTGHFGCDLWMLKDLRVGSDG